MTASGDPNKNECPELRSFEQATAIACGEIVKSTFKPHPLLSNPHVQTVWPTWFRIMPQLDIRLERIELADGDFFNIGWSGDTHRGSPIAVLVHGYSGDFSSMYLRGLARQLVAIGWRVAMLGFVAADRFGRPFYWLEQRLMQYFMTYHFELLTASASIIS